VQPLAGVFTMHIMAHIYRLGLTCDESIHKCSNKTFARNQSSEIISY
jgi:hypothetical protein